MKKKCKVLVVGAGPAGTSAAFFLKHFDKNDEFNVTLVDRLPEKKYNLYHRMCGEAVSKSAFTEITPIKPSNIVERINKIREIYPCNNIVETQVKGFILNRANFLKKQIRDFKKLGGNFIQDSIVNAKSNKSKVSVNFEQIDQKDFDYVIAADGANSILRTNLSKSSFLVKPFLQYLVHKKVPHDTLTFIYDEKYKGDYSWIFPNGNTTKIGFPLINNNFFDIEEKIVKKQVRFIGFGGINQLVKDRILFVGDAACQTNPITKGGIRPAMVAGKIAAKAIILRKPAYYESEWLKTTFASPSFYFVYKYLTERSNKQLATMANHFLNQKTSKFENKLAAIFELCNKVGW